MAFEIPEIPKAVPPVEKQESESFEQKAEKLGQKILGDLEKIYPETEYEYHNMPHSKGVGDQAVELLSSGIEREKAIIQLIGYAHDYVQTYQDPWPSRGDGKVGFKRVRFSGQIEADSFEALVKKCEEEGLTLTEEEKNIAKEAIMATVPGWSMELSTVTQPKLEPGAHDITFAIAAADIASSGFDPEHFLKDGYNVFNEDNLLPRPETLTDPEAEQLLQEVLGWSGLQIKYAAGQKALWSRDFIPDAIKAKLTGFDESIRLCTERYNDCVALIAAAEKPQEKLQLLLDKMNFKRYITV